MCLIDCMLCNQMANKHHVTRAYCGTVRYFLIVELEYFLLDNFRHKESLRVLTDDVLCATEV